MQPAMIKCSRFLAEQWPELLKAAGLSVCVDPGTVSGTVRQSGRDLTVTFRPMHDRYCCLLNEIPDAPTVTVLSKSLLASGARADEVNPAILDVAALFGFRHKTGVPDWNGAAGGLATFVTDGTATPGGILDLPHGHIDGGPVDLTFVTGPAYSVEDRELAFYLEIVVDVPSRQPGLEEFVAELAERLRECGVYPVVLWGHLEPCAVFT